MRLTQLARTSVALSVAAALVTGAHAAASDPGFPTAGSVDPRQDAFYVAPENVAKVRPGAVVRSRPIVPPAALGGPAELKGWQIGYRSNDSHDRANLAVTTLLVPRAPWTGKGPRPAVSVQAPINSTGIHCAPSYAIAAKNGTGDGAVSLALELGYAVAVPDHLGPKSVYIAGPQEAHATLDGIRAARAFKPGGLSNATPWGMYGYSGGAHATSWAAELQPTYAPELRLAGAAIGGTPSNLRAVSETIDGTAFSGLLLGSAVSIATEWPEAKIDSFLTEEGKELFRELKGKCSDELLSGYGFRRVSDYTTVSDPMSQPSLARVLATNMTGQAAPRTPVYSFHAIPDEVVPVQQADDLLVNWCAKGAQVVKVRDIAGEHLSEAVTRQQDAVDWLQARFTGQPLTDRFC